MYVFLGLIGDVLGSVTGLLDGLVGIIFKEVIPIVDIQSILHRLHAGDNPTTLFELMRYRVKTSFWTWILFNHNNYPIDLTYAKPVFYRISQMNDGVVPIREMVNQMGCLKSRLSQRILRQILDGIVEGEDPTYKQILQHINKYKKGSSIMSYDFFALWHKSIFKNVPMHLVLGSYGKKFGSFDVALFKKHASSWKKQVLLRDVLTAIEKPNHNGNMWELILTRLHRLPKVHRSESESKGLLGGILGGKSKNSGGKTGVLGSILGGLKKQGNNPRFHTLKRTHKKPSKSNQKTLVGGLLG